MRPIRALLVWLALLVAAPATAQTIPAVTSAAPDSVAVTIYRAPANRSYFDKDWPEGYALITEKRTVHIPAGRSLIRFEGVASGILPESALVSGLPDGVSEKNLDANLLSARTLYGYSYGRPVTLTHRNVNGTMVSERAIIRSAPDGAAIFETKDGFITADCTGSDAIVYDAVPPGLSAKPTLSIETNSAEAHDVTLSLSYLAWGFDWQVNYVATMRPDGKTADLTAWATLASADVTSFADADTMLIGGTVNREDGNADDVRARGDDRPLTFKCMATHVDRVVPEPVTVDAITAEDVGAFPDTNLTRSSASVVDAISAEDLGDVKLYRLPERTTVASNGQKQVLMFDRPSIPVELVYRAYVDLDDSYGLYDVRILMRVQNRKERGLGIPLPGGNVALFEPLGDRRLLVGEGRMWDRPVGEEIDIELADSEQVNVDYLDVPPRRGWEGRVLVATNANPYPVRFEARIRAPEPDEDTDKPAKPVRLRGDVPLTYKAGDAIWSVEIPANSSVSLRLRK